MKSRCWLEFNDVSQNFRSSFTDCHSRWDFISSTKWDPSTLTERHTGCKRTTRCPSSEILSYTIFRIIYSKLCVSVLTFCRQFMEWGERTRKLSDHLWDGCERTDHRAPVWQEKLLTHIDPVSLQPERAFISIPLSLRQLVSHSRLVRRHSAHWSETWVRIAVRKTSHEHKLILYPSSSSVSAVRRLVFSASETRDDCVCRSRTICDSSTGFLSNWYFRIPSLHSVVSHNNF